MEQEGCKLLKEFIKSNDIESVRKILEQAKHAYTTGFNRDSNGFTVLLLISRGFAPTTHTYDLMRMNARHVSPTMLQTILQPKYRRFVGNLEDVDTSGRTALQNACMYLNAPLVTLLIHAGANVNSRGLADQTPLLYACKAGYMHRANASGAAIFADADTFREQILNILLDNNAEIHALDQNGNTPLAVSVLHGHTDSVRLLIDRGVDVFKRNTIGLLVRLAVEALSFQPLNDENTGLDLIELLILQGLDIHDAFPLAASGSLSTSRRSGFRDLNVGRYAARLLRLIRLEIPTQTKLWADGNVRRKYEAMCMSHIARLGANSSISKLPPDMFRSICGRVDEDRPKSMAAAALQAIRQRHGRLPILDSDEVIPSYCSVWGR
jgi:ankyrin repeat protein